MKMTKTSIITILIAALSVFTLQSCKEETPAEKIGEGIEDAADEVGDAVEDATD